MNIPMSWLKAYVDLDVNINEFVDEMTMSGSKVETVEHLGEGICNVVVGKVLSVEKHPDADKLVITQIDAGGGQTVQIVTGATNVTAGCTVPVALEGAVLHGGVKIKKTKFRGVDSQGMLCSIEELGYTRQDYPEAPEDGIYLFLEEYAPGSDACEILEIKDDVVEFEITSNRPDCYSVMGIAREAAATFNKPLKYPEVKLEEKADGDITQMIQVEIKNPELCPRYIARVVKNVKIEPSPQWMRHRLTAAGVRPINNIVDITNYVMLELGQPMHAFDIENIEGGKIIVRNAVEGERFVTLDGQERTLDTSMLVIADCNKAVAVAGVMGGENSKVTGGSSAILFESANFNGPNVRITSKKLGLRTDASAKYEKGLDPNLSLEAVNRCVQLVEMLGYGEVVPGMVDCYPNKREPWTVDYDPASICRLLGADISAEDMVAYLKRVEVVSDGKTAQIPTFRPDIESEADIAEEIARLYGYNKIKSTLAAGTPTVGKRTYIQTLEDITRNTMVSLGYSEGMHYSFESPKVFDKLNIPAESVLRDTVKINNPLGEDFSIMRTTTLSGMLQSLSTNYNRRNEAVHLFEMAKVYLPKALPLTELPDEKQVLTIGMYAMDPKSGKDFYYIKGAVETLAEVFGLGRELAFVPNEGYPYMHPGRTADICYDSHVLGYVGEVHPAILDNYEIGVKTYIAVVDLEALFQHARLERSYVALPKFPAITRDISMVVKDEIPVGEIAGAIREKSGKLMETVTLFDVYKGQQITEGCKSVSFKLSFRAGDRTLKDDEINSAMEKILKNLESKYAVQLRDK